MVYPTVTGTSGPACSRSQESWPLGVTTLPPTAAMFWRRALFSSSTSSRRLRRSFMSWLSVLSRAFSFSRERFWAFWSASALLRSSLVSVSWFLRGAFSSLALARLFSASCALLFRASFSS